MFTPLLCSLLSESPYSAALYCRIFQGPACEIRRLLCVLDWRPTLARPGSRRPTLDRSSSQNSHAVAIHHCSRALCQLFLFNPRPHPPRTPAPGSKTRLEPTPEPSGICITDPPFSLRQSTTLCGAGSPASPEQRHTESRVPLITDRPAPNCLQLGPLDGKKPLAPHDCSCFSSSSAQRTERPSRLHFHNILIFQQPRESIPVQGRRKHGGHHG